MQEDHPADCFYDLVKIESLSIDFIPDRLDLGPTDLAARPPYLNYKHLGYKDPPQDHHVLKMSYVYYRLFIPFCLNFQGGNLKLNHIMYPEAPYYRLTWLIRWVAR